MIVKFISTSFSQTQQLSFLPTVWYYQLSYKETPYLVESIFIWKVICCLTLLCNVAWVCVEFSCSNESLNIMQVMKVTSQIMELCMKVHLKCCVFYNSSITWKSKSLKVQVTFKWFSKRKACRLQLAKLKFKSLY